MLQVELDHILSEDDATTNISEIIAHVEDNKEVYVVTKNGKPAVAIIDIEKLNAMTLSGNEYAPAQESTPLNQPDLPPVRPTVPENMPGSEPMQEDIFAAGIPPMPNPTTDASVATNTGENTAQNLPPFPTEFPGTEGQSPNSNDLPPLPDLPSN